VEGVRANTDRRSVRFAWNLSRMEDRNGNSMTVHYTRDEVNYAYEYLPAEIRYTAFRDDRSGGNSRIARRSVTFTYEERPDVDLYYVAGLALRSPHRLSRIEMRWSADPPATTLLRSYNLRYQHAPTSGRSLLKEVQECDGAGVCIAPTSFEWSRNEDGFEEIDTGIDVVGTYPNLQGYPLDARIRTGDIDGDGRDDILYREWSGHWYYRLSLSTGRGFDDPQPAPFAPPPEIISIVNRDNQKYLGGGSDTTLADMNGDGRVDATQLQWVTSKDTGRTVFQDQLWLSTGADFQGVAGGPEREPSSDAERPRTQYALDLNGDGLPDLLSTARRSPPGPDVWAYSLNHDGAPGEYIQTDLEYTEAPDLTHPPKAVAVDLDGSGRQSLLIPSAGVAIGLEAGSLRRESAAIGDGLCPPIFLDLNGDGLVDEVERGVGRDPQPGALFININTGNGYIPLGEWRAPWPTSASYALQCGVQQNRDPRDDPGFRIVDLNGDGRQDLLLMSGGYDPDHDLGTLEVLESTGTGFEPRSLIGSNGGISVGRTSTRARPYSGNDPPPDRAHDECNLSQTLDVNGDGLEDFVQFFSAYEYIPPAGVGGSGRTVEKGGSLHLYIRRGGHADLVTRVTDGLGAIEQFDYAPVSDASVYTPGVDCHYPRTCVTRGAWVVRTHWVRGSESTPVIRSYTYRDGRTDLAGRGWLGFSQQVVVDHRQGERTTTLTLDTATRVGTFYPCSGFVTRSESQEQVVRFSPSGNQLIWHELNQLSDCEVMTASGGKILFTYPRRTELTESEADADRPGGSVAWVVRRKTIQSQQQDSYGNRVNMETLTYAADSIGVVGRPHRQLTTATYDNFDASWLIGQMMRQDEVSTTRSGESVLRRVEYERDPVTGLVTKKRIAPADPDASKAFEALEVTLERDTFGLVSAIRRSGSGETRTDLLEYDDTEHTLLTSATNAAGHRSEFLYLGGLDVLAASRDANGIVSKYQYDRFGRARFEDAPNDGDTALHYERQAASTSERVLAPFKLRVERHGAPASEADIGDLGAEVARRWQRQDGQWAEQRIGHDEIGRVSWIIFPDHPDKATSSSTTRWIGPLVCFNPTERGS
jgi:hypothetical protein